MEREETCSCDTETERMEPVDVGRKNEPCPESWSRKVVRSQKHKNECGKALDPGFEMGLGCTQSVYQTLKTSTAERDFSFSCFILQLISSVRKQGLEPRVG